MPIVDQHGRPFAERKLTESVAYPTASVRRTIETTRILPGVDTTRLARVLRNAESADIFELLTFAEEIERRDLHYASVLNTRKLAVWGLPTRIEAASDSAEDVAIADFLRDEVISRPFFRQLLRDSLDALAKGTSLLEILWDTSTGQWVPNGAQWVDPRWLTWIRKDPNDRTNGVTPYLKTEREQTHGEPLHGLGAGKWLLHQARLRSGPGWRDGFMWPMSVYFVFKNVTVRDWLAYAEVFGMPVRVGKHQAGATERDIQTLKTAVSNIGSDAGAVIPETMQLEFVGVAGGSGGEMLFMHLVDWIDKQVSKGVLGQTMTAEDGSSLAQAIVHDRVRTDLWQADADNLSNTIQEQLIVPIVKYNFGEQSRYPKFEIGREGSEDLKTLAATLPMFLDRGLKVSASEIRDKFNLAEPDPDEDILTGASSLQVEAPQETPA